MLISNLSTYSNRSLSFKSSKNKNSAAKSSATDAFVKAKSTPSHTKAYYVAQVLPKVRVEQRQLDEIFSDDAFAKKVLDRDWYNQWKIAMSQKAPLPTTGFCYPAAEFFYYFVDHNTQPMLLKSDDIITDPKTGKSRGETHYFLMKEDTLKTADANFAEYKVGNNIIYDPTRSQFGKDIPEYNGAKKTGFLTEFPSKKACQIAEKLGIISKDLAKTMPKIFRDKKYLNLSFEDKLALLKSVVKKH